MAAAIIAVIVTIVGLAMLGLVRWSAEAIREDIKENTREVAELRHDLYDHLAAHGERPWRKTGER